jgi:hypothetical protein
MRAMGLQGAVRGRAWVTTTHASAAAELPADLVERDFTATRANQLWVSDFTYVATWEGFVYVAFVIDVFARRVVGWRASASLCTDFVLDALEQAIADRCAPDTGAPVHHSDRGTRYLSIRYAERLVDAGIELSVGSRGDAFDNALAETVIGLFKTEVIRRRGPWRSLEAVEFATLEWPRASRRICYASFRHVDFQCCDDGAGRRCQFQSVSCRRSRACWFRPGVRRRQLGPEGSEERGGAAHENHDEMMLFHESVSQRSLTTCQLTVPWAGVGLCRLDVFDSVRVIRGRARPQMTFIPHAPHF